jgi:hypothetical protein
MVALGEGQINTAKKSAVFVKPRFIVLSFIIIFLKLRGKV